MPLYEYECTKCQERVEVIQNFSDAPYSHCPECGGDMKKLISAPAIQFKGSGFYKTDYGSSSPSGGSGKKAESKSEPKSESESKSESKPESKSDGAVEKKSEKKAE